MTFYIYYTLARSSPRVNIARDEGVEGDELKKGDGREEGGSKSSYAYYTLTRSSRIVNVIYYSPLIGAEGLMDDLVDRDGGSICNSITFTIGTSFSAGFGAGFGSIRRSDGGAIRIGTGVASGAELS
jgi:hypothetical protein